MSSESTIVDREEASAGLSVAVGAPIPSIGLRASDGYLLNLRSYVKRQPVALVFFAAPTAEGAQLRRGTKVAESLAAAHRRLSAAGIAVVGVTCDNERQQAEWIAATSFPYLLFSDERRAAVSVLGIPVSQDGENHNVEQPWILVVGADGLLKAVLRDPDPEYVADLVLAAVRRSLGLDDGDEPLPRGEGRAAEGRAAEASAPGENAAGTADPPTA
jgi:peroxiredoxin